MSDDFDFSSIAPDKPTWITMFQAIRANSDAPIRLNVKHAGDGNPAFVNARMKMQAARDRATGYERTAMLYAKHVIVSWENVCKPDGTPLPFSHEDCERLLSALLKAKRTDAIDYLVAFCSDADNFHDPVQPAADLGKG